MGISPFANSIEDLGGNEYGLGGTLGMGGDISGQLGYSPGSGPTISVGIGLGLGFSWYGYRKEASDQLIRKSPAID